MDDGSFETDLAAANRLPLFPSVPIRVIGGFECLVLFSEKCRKHGAKEQNMQTNLSPRGYLLVPVLLLLPGCGQKLNYETTVKLGDGDVQLVLVDPPTRKQKVSVTATSSGSPIAVYIILEKDKETAKQALLDGKKPAAALDGSAKTKDATLEAIIPANSGFAILLGGASKGSEVKVRVTGR